MFSVAAEVSPKPYILANSLLIGNNEKSNENMGKNKDGNYEEHNSNNVFPDYETCDEMPNMRTGFKE